MELNLNFKFPSIVLPRVLFLVEGVWFMKVPVVSSSLNAISYIIFLEIERDLRFEVRAVSMPTEVMRCLVYLR